MNVCFSRCLIAADVASASRCRDRYAFRAVFGITLGWLLISLGCSRNASETESNSNAIRETLAAPPEAQEPQDESPPRVSTTLPSDETLHETLDGAEGRELLLRNFRPESQLHVASTQITSAKFPVVDVHTHFRFRTKNSTEFLDDFVELMDRNQIAVCVSMDGQLGNELDDHLNFLWSNYPDRFVVFAHIDWQGGGEADDPQSWDCNQSGFVRRTVENLKAAKEAGVSGLKLFKRFGLTYLDPEGNPLRIDDPRWDPIWKTCGELGMPILIHTADPAAFFLPIDKLNERWEELSRHPDWSFYGDQFPSRQELLDARNRVIQRHPDTKFIGAHVANNAENLAEVAEWLDQYPNLYIEFASRISELGRQPYTARKFILNYQDRILFGTDGPWPETRVHLYWRFMETYDEYFPYSEKEPPPQGLWYIYGVGLPDETLQAIYYENAARLIPGVKEKLARFQAESR